MTTAPPQDPSRATADGPATPGPATPDTAAPDPRTAPEGPEGPPPHVRAAFGVRDLSPRARHGLPSPAWTCGSVLLRPVADTRLAAWSAGALEDLAGAGVDGVRTARPLRASDGRRVVGGWSAVHDLPGRVEPRHDDVVAASLRLHRATAALERPKIVDDRDDILTRADRAAFAEQDVALDPETGGTLFAELARRRRDVPAPAQLVHGDLFGTVLFDAGPDGAPGEPPAVLDLVPFWRPVEWAAAVVVVDALAWGGADPALPGRWAHLEAWPQMLLHALLFRLAVHAQHPACTRESLGGLEHVARLVSDLL